MSTGELIRKYRTAKGMTQLELGEKIGIKQQMVGQYESGKRKPKLETLQKIANALDVPVVYLRDDLGFIYNTEQLLKLLDDNLIPISSDSNVINTLANSENLLLAQLEIIGYDLILYPPYVESHYMINHENTISKIPYEEIKLLEQENLSYLKFKIEELIKKYDSSK